jgi:hypothetical protein
MEEKMAKAKTFEKGCGQGQSIIRMYNIGHFSSFLPLTILFVHFIFIVFFLSIFIKI